MFGSCCIVEYPFNVLWFATFLSVVFGYSSMLNVHLLADSKAGKVKKGYRSCGERCVHMG